MARRPSADNPSCPHCHETHVVKDGHKRGQQRWRCRGCARTFGPTVGTPLYRLHTPAAEVARSLLVVMRRGSLTAAEELTGHKYETIGTWLRRAGDHAAALTEALVHDLHLWEVEVDAFWSFVRRSAARLGSAPRPVRPGWAHAGAA